MNYCCQKILFAMGAPMVLTRKAAGVSIFMIAGCGGYCCSRGDGFRPVVGICSVGRRYGS